MYRKMSIFLDCHRLSPSLISAIARSRRHSSNGKLKTASCAHGAGLQSFPTFICQTAHLPGRKKRKTCSSLTKSLSFIYFKNIMFHAEKRWRYKKTTCVSRLPWSIAFSCREALDHDTGEHVVVKMVGGLPIGRTREQVRRAKALGTGKGKRVLC